ncbi:condensation domain-containing protein [Kutzneria sp. NPDC052558]|uniref:condensation domain-containing protein n=1 Tax=Kutzneria sp. NPDC052558 TaxID=3364121 RepID=UPI0037C659DF
MSVSNGRLAVSSEAYVFPASFAQQRMWFMCQLNPRAHRAYHMSGAFDVDGTLDVDVLRAAAEILVERHEVLRTRFVLFDEDERQLGGELCQVVEPEGSLPVDTVAVPDGQWEAELADDPPLDLDALPLARMRLLTDSSGQQMLQFTAHHIVCDGWSVAVFFDELATVYGAIAAGRPPGLPAAALQYVDFSEWQREQTDGLIEDLAYWRTRLADTPPLALPSDRERPPLPSFRGGRIPVHLPAPLAAAVARFASTERATPFQVLLSAYQVLFARRSGQPDFGIGTPVAGRGRPELERGIGVFVNTVVLRADLSGDPTYRELVRRVRDASLDDFAHQDVPFEQVVAQVAPDRDLRRSALFQVFFAMQNTPAPVVELPGARLTAREVPRDTAMFDLRLALRPDGDALDGWLEFNADLFDEDTARRMAIEWLDIVEELLDEPDAKVRFDRAALTAPTRPATATAAGDDRPRGPRTPLEAELAAIFCTLLGRDELDIRASFFDLGGNSLLAVRAMRQIRRAMRVAVPVETIFALTSVEQLAEAIEAPEILAGTPDSEGIRVDIESMWRHENRPADQPATTQPEGDHR